MGKISPKGDAARLFLIDHPEFKSERSRKPIAEYDDEYAKRLASGARKQLEARLTPNKQALRGHILTPEHGPKGAKPKLPEKAENYKQVAKTSKESRLTGETPSRPSQGRTEALTGERRPILHSRERGESHIPFAENGAIYTRNQPGDARAVIAEAAAHDDRLVMQVYDCSRRRWYPVFRHYNATGISAGYLLDELHDHGGSFEQYFLDVVNDASYNDKGKISHICQYELTILPKPTAAVRALQEQMKHRR